MHGVNYYLAIVRIGTLILILLPLIGFSQEKADSIVSLVSEWESENYTQEDKIYSRSVWTFIDNPALAGFDRKLAVAYRFRMKNLAMGVPNDEGNLELAFMKHEAFVDLPFGGPKQNWGMGLYYAHEKELTHRFHTVQMARSLRIKLVDSHFLTLGFSFGLQFSKLDNWEGLTFGDMIDPRFGFIYNTNEIEPNTSRLVAILQGGLRYNWKRFSFDYSFHQGPNGLGGLTGSSSILVANRIKTAYHFNVGDGVTISPEISLNITNVNVRSNQLATSILSAFATISYKDIVYGQLGVADLNRFTFRAGYQVKDYLVIELGGSSYINETMVKIAGPASVQAGIRYQIKAWN